MLRFDPDALDAAAVRAHAERFDVSEFDAGIRQVVAGALTRRAPARSASGRRR
jgi:hypothetical protein